MRRIVSAPLFRTPRVTLFFTFDTQHCRVAFDFPHFHFVLPSAVSLFQLTKSPESGRNAGMNTDNVARLWHATQFEL